MSKKGNKKNLDVELPEVEPEVKPEVEPVKTEVKGTSKKALPLRKFGKFGKKGK